MQLFVSSYVMRFDKKGRVSVPAPFRTTLTADGYPGLYLIPTLERTALDAGGNRLMAQFDAKLSALDPTSREHDLLTAVFYGQSEIAGFDPEGRISLSERMRSLAGLTDQAVFVGKGHKFQIWSPERHEAYLDTALDKARQVLWGTDAASGGVSS
ncbi:MAG: division/cell wall cluster transcriptional repressor MraZ [Hyphomicrobiaceae bacterium]|nr:division/cell wall cluster transcriptional repressor MraZ [Hyphomicrobiaceae bacterium]